MSNWEFRDPIFFVLLLLVPLVYWLAIRRNSALCFSSVSLVGQITPSWRMRLSHAPALLLSVAMFLLVVALARPRSPQHESRESRDGIAIMMVVDLSSSMNARDLVVDDRSVNRLAVVKEVFLDFIFGEEEIGDGRADDLVGLVTFAGYADSICPLTLDHGNLASIVRDLRIVGERSEDGTSIGDGLGLAVERLRRSKAKSRIAILLTDGVNNAGAIEPNKAAELAAANDIKVYCIGAGTNGMALMPTIDFFGGRTLTRQPVEIDEKTLQQIASKTGGQYFRAVDRDSLAGVYSEIDKLERTEVSEIRFRQYSEHYARFVLAGLSLIALSTVLNHSIFRRLP